MKTNGNLLFIYVAILMISCVSHMTVAPCVKGKYMELYCGNIVIEIMDGSKIGRNWTGMFHKEEHKNSVIASLDSSVFKTRDLFTSQIPSDSIIYFQYKKGGYPRSEYSLCEPASFITITAMATNPCTLNDTD